MPFGRETDSEVEIFCSVCVVVIFMNIGLVAIEGKDGASGKECALSVADRKVRDVFRMFSELFADRILAISRESEESRAARRPTPFERERAMSRRPSRTSEQ